MAFINKEDVKAKRDALKVAFPSKDGWKFSVTGTHTSTVRIALMAYPKDYTFPESGDVNHNWIPESIERQGGGEKEIKVFQQINDIAHAGHWDKSDTMTDYFNCSYYIDLSVGKWNRPAVAV